MKFDLIGSYEASYEEEGERLPAKMVILDNGKVQSYLNGKIDNVTEIDWVTGKELSLGSGVYRVDLNERSDFDCIYLCLLARLPKLF